MVLEVTGGQIEVTEGQFLMTIPKEAIFCIYTHINDTYTLQYVILA